MSARFIGPTGDDKSIIFFEWPVDGVKERGPFARRRREWPILKDQASSPWLRGTICFAADDVIFLQPVEAAMVQI